MAKKPPKAKTKNAVPIADELAHAIALGTNEIRKGVSDAQIELSLQDAGINIKKLPPNFLKQLRGGASFKPKPPKPFKPVAAKNKRKAN